MAGLENVSISRTVLKNAGYKNLSMRAGDGGLDRQDLLEVKAIAREELAKLKAALTSNDNSILEEHFKDASARESLKKMIDEVEADSSSTPGADDATTSGTTEEIKNKTSKKEEVSQGDISTTLNSIKEHLKASLPKDAQYLSKLRAAMSILPSYEVSDENDLHDILFQKKQYTEKYVKWLTKEYNKKDAKYPISLNMSSWLLESGSGKPGWWPGLSGEMSIESYEDKKIKIQEILKEIDNHWENAPNELNKAEELVEWLLNWQTLGWGVGGMIGIAIWRGVKANKYTAGIANNIGNAASASGRLGVAAAKKVPGMVNNATFGRQAAPTTTPEDFAKRFDGLRNSVIESIVNNRDMLSNNRSGGVMDLPAHPTQVDYNASLTEIRQVPVLRAEFEKRMTQLANIQAHINAGNIRMTEPQFNALLGDIVRGKKIVWGDLKPWKGAGIAGNTYQLYDRATATVSRKFLKNNTASARVDEGRMHDAISAAEAHAQLQEQIGAASNMPAHEWQVFEERIARTASDLEQTTTDVERFKKELADLKEKKETVGAHNDALTQATMARDLAQTRYDAENMRVNTDANSLSSQVAVEKARKVGLQAVVDAIDLEIAELEGKIANIKDVSLVGSEVSGVPELDAEIAELDTKIGKQDTKIRNASNSALIESIPGVSDITSEISDLDLNIKKEEKKIANAKDPVLVATEVAGIDAIDREIAALEASKAQALDTTVIETNKQAKITERSKLISEYIKGIEVKIEIFDGEKKAKIKSRSTLIAQYINVETAEKDKLEGEKKTKVSERAKLIAPEKAALESQLRTKKLEKFQNNVPLTESSAKLAGLEETFRKATEGLAVLESKLHTAQDALTSKGVAKTPPRDKALIEADIATANREMSRLGDELRTIISDIEIRTTVKFKPIHLSLAGGLQIEGQKVDLGTFHSKIQTYVHTGLKAGVRH